MRDFRLDGADRLGGFVRGASGDVDFCVGAVEEFRQDATDAAGRPRDDEDLVYMVSYRVGFEEVLFFFFR